ncbi:MAG: immune inhibitor A [Anaerolineales bacterium]|nr:immune inhibitor A [Anaerolineales bacterium]
MNKSNRVWIIVLIVLAILIVCCLVLIAAGVYGWFSTTRYIEDYTPPNTPTPEPPIIVKRPTETIREEEDTLSVLQNTIIPENNLYELACRLQGICDVPVTMASTSVERQVGENDTFWVVNADTNEHFSVDATLQYATPHLYFWIQDGVQFRGEDVKKLSETFETEIYPTNRDFFGSEWTPGVDGDPHIYVLFARNLGNYVGGYYSSADEVNPLVCDYSNGHEMFLVNADGVSLGSQSIYGTLAHEHQHMIHWYQDRNETIWLNEGFSVLSEFLYGYPTWVDGSYISHTDTQLTDWSPEQSENANHYGASFLFTTYFLDRFGNEATRALIRNPENGLESIEGVLTDIGAVDTVSGQAVTADDLVVDWMITNYLLDASVADGRYTYHNKSDTPKARPNEEITDCPNTDSYRVRQYGADYLRITCSGDYTLYFEGSTIAHLLPVDAYSGAYAFWSNKGDESNMTLTRTFDFSDVNGPITFTYWTWYDIEEDYDYLYLDVSENGRAWEIITTPSGTGEDPTGNSFGWGYNSYSDGWIQEEVDFSQYAGKVIQVRFEYVTDAAVNGEGLLLDDIAIPETGYFEDFENDTGDWEAAGFARVNNSLPQTFRLALILKHSDSSATVKYIPVSEEQTAEIPLHLGDDIQEATLLVTGTTRFTRIPADYLIEIR